MSRNIRRTGGRAELNAQWGVLNSLLMLLAFSTLSDPGIVNGTTAGNLQTSASADFRISNRVYTKAATDDLWDLSGETDTAAGKYRAYWLYLDAAGAASFVASSSDGDSAAEALSLLPAHDDTKSILGVFVAGPATDFDDAGGLAAQGIIHDGIPAGVPVGVRGESYAAPERIALVGA